MKIKRTESCKFRGTTNSINCSYSHYLVAAWILYVYPSLSRSLSLVLGGDSDCVKNYTLGLSAKLTCYRVELILSWLKKFCRHLCRHHHLILNVIITVRIVIHFALFTSSS